MRAWCRICRFPAAAGWRHCGGMSIAQQTRASTIRPATPLVAIGSVILSMSLVAIGNGLLFTYVPVKLGAVGLSPAWGGAILTALSAGGLLGCLLTGRLVARVGHARVFMTFAALIILSNATISIGTYPVLWMASRALYGIAIAGLFIVAQSWLNDAVGNAIRGRVMAMFYIAYIVGLGLGSLTLTLVDIGGDKAPVIAIAFAALSIVPVGLTTLRPPPPPESASVALRRAWSISPVGVGGMLAVGGLSMMVAGFAPIHATASGFSKDDVAILMVAMQVGTIFVQLPLGWASDRTDRRYVLIAAAVLVIVAAALATATQSASYLWIVLIFLLWSGATESIYSISSAHANDRASPSDLVLLSSTMLFAWSLSGFVIPGIATTLTLVFGTQAFMYIAIAIAATFCIFVAWRIGTAPKTAEPGGSFAPMSAQAPLPADLAFSGEEKTSKA
jgi:MFS family permease